MPSVWSSRLPSRSEPRDHRARAAREAVLGTAWTRASAQDGFTTRPTLSLPMRRRADRGPVRDDSRSALHVVCYWVGPGVVRCTGVVGRGSTATDKSMEGRGPDRDQRLGYLTALDSSRPCGHVTLWPARFTHGFHGPAGGRAGGAGTRFTRAAAIRRGIGCDAGLPRSSARYAMTISLFPSLGPRPPGTIPAGLGRNESWLSLHRTPRLQKGTP